MALTPVATLDNGPDLETLHKWDRLHQLHPWAAVDDWQGYNNMLVDSASGIYLWDGNGKRFIDGPGGMWCVQIGYDREEMADAIAAQVRKLPYTSPFSNTTEPSSILAKELADMAPGDLNNVFFTTGGSTAVDTALRTMHFMNNRMGRPKKKIVLAREKGYHGSTYLAHSVTGKERTNNRFDVESRLVHFLPDVNPYRRPEGMSVDDWCDAKVADLEAAIVEVGPENLGAFIAEPILSSGGVIVPPPGYHKRTFDICRAHDILYISDGGGNRFRASRALVLVRGRVRHSARHDHLRQGADLRLSGRLGACIISDRVMERISDPDEPVSFTNGYTYSAHPVSCVAALKNIEIMRRERILEHVREISPHFQKRLSALTRFDFIGDARGMGLLGCIEGKADSLAGDTQLGAMIDAACEERGLLVRPLINMAVFSPPLIITLAQVDEMFDILEAALEDVGKKLASNPEVLA